MAQHPLAGQPVPHELLVDLPQLISDYYTLHPDPEDPRQRVSFGTSGHRGTSGQKTFNEDHILAIAQAICDYRVRRGITGPLFLGRDTHALSEPSHATALEVFAANGVTTMIHRNRGFTPTPVISHAILCFNRGKSDGLADGVVITPSHNPPEDGGFKYNPPHGGPAGTEETRWIQDRANDLLAMGRGAIRRMPYEKALRAETTHSHDFVTPYVEDLSAVIDMDAAKAAEIAVGVDPLGGAAVGFWDRIAEVHGLNLKVVNPVVDPSFRFMTLDKDGKVRMDCSSLFAMAGIIGLKADFDIAFGNDPDVDRHGIVTPAGGLMNPNHYLAVAIDYLFRTREQWPRNAAIGKTLVTSSMVDRVARDLDRPLAEVPVGFKWFVDGLYDGSYGFGGEESAGASFLRLDGSPWTTDKDGILLNLLAVEILAKTGKDPADLYRAMTDRFGAPIYERLQAPADSAQKTALKNLSPDLIHADQLAGEPILQKLTHAPGNNAPIGGLKVVAENGWFAARPSGTEDIYKIYTESFKGEAHLKQIQAEAKAIVAAAFKAAGV